MTNALRRHGDVMYNLLFVLVSGASLAIVGSPTFAHVGREFMMIRSLIHASSVMLASAVLALSFAAAPARAAAIRRPLLSRLGVPRRRRRRHRRVVAWPTVQPKA